MVQVAGRRDARLGAGKATRAGVAILFADVAPASATAIELLVHRAGTDALTPASAARFLGPVIKLTLARAARAYTEIDDVLVLDARSGRLAALPPSPPPPAPARMCRGSPAGTSLVVLSATAVDERGRPVTNLRSRRVPSPRGRAPAASRALLRWGATLPARLLLLVDASGSMNGTLKTTSAQHGRHADPGRAAAGGRGRPGRLRSPLLGPRSVHPGPGAHPARDG